MEANLHPLLEEKLKTDIEPALAGPLNKTKLLILMRGLGFDIHDIAYLHEQEVVAKRCEDGSLIFWEMEREGSGFTRLFKGQIKQACEEK